MGNLRIEIRPGYQEVGWDLNTIKIDEGTASAGWNLQSLIKFSLFVSFGSSVFHERHEYFVLSRQTISLPIDFGRVIFG